MTDPFEPLLDPAQPRLPRSQFRGQLRRRLLAELHNEQDTQMPPTQTFIVTPYLTAHDAARALDFYAAAFGAVEVHRFVGDDGRIGHAEFTIGGATFYLSDAYPEVGAASPEQLGGTSVALVMGVASVDDAFADAVAAGAAGVRPPTNEAHGTRSAWITDPFGHRWNLFTPLNEAFDPSVYNDGDHGFEVQ